MLHSFEQLAHTKCTNAQMHKCTNAQFAWKRFGNIKYFLYLCKINNKTWNYAC